MSIIKFLISNGILLELSVTYNVFNESSYFNNQSHPSSYDPQRVRIPIGTPKLSLGGMFTAAINRCLISDFLICNKILLAFSHNALNFSCVIIDLITKFNTWGG